MFLTLHLTITKWTNFENVHRNFLCEMVVDSVYFIFLGSSMKTDVVLNSRNSYQCFECTYGVHVSIMCDIYDTRSKYM